LHRNIETTRLESWATPGVPDVVCCNEKGQFTFLELKVVKKNKCNLSPHQIAWLSRHAHSNSFIVALHSDLAISVFRGGDSVNLCVGGVDSVQAVGIFKEPYEWKAFWNLTCGAL
tara:strand:- start:916 stop:1260 length:345 start_codon:yes stop_codon:yes gene_type:complete